MFHCIVLIDDKRYSIPTLWMTTIADMELVRDMAQAKLDESNQHLRVQVFIDDELVCSVQQGVI
jgi:hypothetical protein